MKKMIFMAALIGGMLVPAQSMALEKSNMDKPGVEYRGGKKYKKNEKKGGRNDRKYKPGKPDRKYKPGKPDRRRPVVVINRPAPRPCPPPPPPRRYYYNNDAADVATAVLSFAAIVSLLAD